MNAPVRPSTTAIYHVVKGRTLFDPVQEFGPAHARFMTPALDIDELVWPRTEEPPLANTPVAEIMDVLEAVGRRLKRDTDGFLAEALELNARTNPLPREILERAYANMGNSLDRVRMQFLLDEELGGADAVDGWREVKTISGRPARVRAYPPRIVHVLAGNGPGAAAQSLMRGALVKGVHLFKMPSNDLFSAAAVLRTLAAEAPDHPMTRSFSAVYWRGGDQRVESMLFRPQFFDKLVAWGGESAIRSAVKYVGPGFELISFDPKTSISFIGSEAFSSNDALAEAADAAAADATLLNQQACVSSRFQFIEASEAEADRFCALLYERMGADRPFSSNLPWATPPQIREEIEGLRVAEDLYRVWGNYDDRGMVIRSEDPVDFHPDGKVVNVVRVDKLDDAVRHVSVATQTVGVYPALRKEGLRNKLAAAGAQRVVTLGAASPELGLPHDGFYPLQRFVRWVNDEG